MSDRQARRTVRSTGIWNVDVRLPGKVNSNSNGARPVHQIKWIRTSRLSIKNSLSLQQVYACVEPSLRGDGLAVFSGAAAQLPRSRTSVNLL